MKRSYYELACRFLAEMELQLAQPMLWDNLDDDALRVPGVVFADDVVAESR